MIALALAAMTATFAAVLPSEEGMVRLPGGSYRPFFSGARLAGAKDISVSVSVSSFALDRHPVTNKQFLAFVRSHPEWRRSRVPRIMADVHYLKDWRSDLSLNTSAHPNSPVTSVSWFAAQAYCEARNKTLPTVDQWEYALADQGRDRERVQAAILDWYGKPNSRQLGRVGLPRPNGFGVSELAGFIWEWNLDFNSFMVSEESRAGSDSASGLFCGNGSSGASDATDYASFMRYSFRFSLKAAYTTENLGFRCARGEEE